MRSEVTRRGATGRRARVRAGKRAALATVLALTAVLAVVAANTATTAPPRAGTAGGAATARADVTAPTGAARSDTRFVWPLAPPHPVVRAFDPPARRYGRGHRGVDLATSDGAAVLAAGDGVVVYAGPLAGRGVVSIQHPDGIRTTYEPVTPTVQRDEHVVAGQLIAHLDVGHPGCRAAGAGADACLHWGALRVGAGKREYVDPLSLLRPAHLRLLPWPQAKPGG